MDGPRGQQVGRTRSAERNQRGSALVMTLIVAMVLMLLGATLLTVSRSEQTIARAFADGGDAFNVAEAGIEHAIAELPSRDLDTLLAAGGVLLPGESLGDGRYRVVVRNNISPEFPAGTIPVDSGGATNDTDGIVVVTSTGVQHRARRVVEMILEQATGGPFRYAVWSDAKLTISSSGQTDSYDSSLGPYPAGLQSTGNVFSNTEISLSGSSMINGDSESAGGPGTGGDPSHVAGSINEGVASQALPNEPCPTGGYTPSVPAGPGASYDPATGKLKVSGGGSLTIPAPPTQYYFSEVVLSGGSTLVIDNPTGVHVDMFVAGKLDVSGGGMVNGAGNPTTLTLWACGPGSSDVKLSGGSGAYYAVYAPNRKVVMSGGSDMYGAIIAGQYTSSGGSMIHFDRSLGGGSSGMVEISNSWREVF